MILGIIETDDLLVLPLVGFRWIESGGRLGKILKLGIVPGEHLSPAKRLTLRYR